MSRQVISCGLCLLMVFLANAVWADTGGAPSPKVRSSRMEVVFRDDLNQLQSIRDLKSGREYANVKAPATLGLYKLGFKQPSGKSQDITSADAVERNFKLIDGGLELRFEHQGATSLSVVCRVLANEADSKIHWQIEVTNRSQQPLVSIEYPRACLRLPLGDNPGDDAILHPLHEGALLCNPQKHLGKQAAYAKNYPGVLSAQVLYYFDPQGGFYYAAADGQGHSKKALVGRYNDTLILAWVHRLPNVVQQKCHVPYDLVWAASEGRWESGADIYRRWTEKQSWCAQKIPQRDMAQWLTRTNVFLNINPDVRNQFGTVDVAAETFARYHGFFDASLVGTVFSWEKNGTWIGPDYFPPRPSRKYYVDLTRKLADRGDHLQLFLSGFRWGVRKPVNERQEEPRKYTDYDGTADFERRGRAMTAVDSQGKLVFGKLPWADNYTLCAAADDAQELLGSCYREIFGWGVAGVDLDQNLGGEVNDCYSTEHGHPPGAGHWQHLTMKRFLDGVRADARRQHRDSFLGVEEPCELYIPQFDIYHGRSLTDTHWPVYGPGAISIPLYAYLYHDYQLGYVGFCDAGFSPLGNVRMGLGRMFLSGMQPGVRVFYPPFRLSGDEPSPELLMARDVVQLLKRTEKYLLLGRMLPTPRVEGSPLIATPEKMPKKHRPWPIDWPVVQATAWQAADGDVCYAMANLSDQPQEVRLALEPHGTSATARLKWIRTTGETLQPEATSLPGSLPVTLKPWEVLCVEQTSGE